MIGELFSRRLRRSIFNSTQDGFSERVAESRISKHASPFLQAESVEKNFAMRDLFVGSAIIFGAVGVTSVGNEDFRMPIDVIAIAGSAVGALAEHKRARRQVAEFHSLVNSDFNATGYDPVVLGNALTDQIMAYSNYLPFELDSLISKA